MSVLPKWKPTAAAKPVPTWNQLPQHAHNDLRSVGCTQQWYEQLQSNDPRVQSDDLRLTVLNLYVKLRGMNLWRFVLSPGSVSKGCFNVLVHDVLALRKTLTEMWNFRDPDKIWSCFDRNKLAGDWDSAEKRATASLHIKHFKGDPINQVQTHIDHYGPWAGNKYAWCLSVPVTGLGHLATYESYSDPQGARKLLSAQGWDPQTLWGVSAGAAASRPGG